MNATVPRGGSLAALLVGIDGELATACTIVLRAAGLRVERDQHVAGACQRIPVMQPYLVVLPSSIQDEARDLIDDRAIAVGAEVVWIDPAADRNTLMATLTSAAEKALAR